MKKTSLYLLRTNPTKFQALADNSSFLKLDKFGWKPVADWRLGSWNEDPFDLS